MKNFLCLFALALTVVLAAGQAHARSSYLDSFNARYGTSGTVLNTCTLCHGATKAASDRNPYGNAVFNASFNFAAIEGLDSDGDGFTNLQEITARTFPGDASSKPAAAVTLTGLSISGPASVNESSVATYAANATWSDSSTSTEQVTWSEDSTYATIGTDGTLTTSAVTGDQTVILTASFTSGGVTRTATKTVTIVDSGPALTPLNDTTTYVQQLYLDFLKRDGEAAGVLYWVNQIDTNKLTKAAAADNFLHTSEYSYKVSSIIRLYLAYFHRIPDFAGLDSWVNQYAQGMTLDEISQSFASSQEFLDTYGALDNGSFVELVYHNVLGRSSDPEGYNFWTGKLDDGTLTRGQLMVGFSDSQEFEALSQNKVTVVGAITSLLRRAPTQAEFDYWTNYINSGSPELDLFSNLLNSSEYAARFGM